jgi:hypothetical protein
MTLKQAQFRANKKTSGIWHIILDYVDYTTTPAYKNYDLVSDAYVFAHGGNVVESYYFS